MSASESLKQFLKEKKEHQETAGARIDWEARKQEKLGLIASLYGEIEMWLKPSTAEGVVTVSRDPCELHDPHMGTITTESLVVEVGQDRVEFRPAVTDVAGGSARVDMRSGGRSITLVFLLGRGWHFIRRIARGLPVKTVPVHEDSFVDALKELLEE